jgi:uncharacterized repeat protein (TIGR02543 family)
VYLDSSTLFLIHNSSFLENEATAGDGGAVYLKKWGQNEHVSLASCMFASNKASGAGGALKIGGGSFSPVINCTFYKNEAGNGGAIHEDGTALELYNSIVSENGANAVPDKEYSSRNVIETSTAAELFVNPGSPKGADGKLGTADDGLRLRRGTLAIDRGTSFEIPTDLFDFDQDGNLTELSPIDLAGNPRIVGASPDLGPYESDWNGTSATPATVQVDLTSGGNGAVSGGGTFASGSIVSLYANAAPGYVFEGWIGDLQSTSNPYSFAAGSNLNLAGNFSKDTGDDDGDGLSNYAELATYGTKVNDNDTDDDGLLDNEEVQIGTNPLSSDATLVNFFNAKTATDQTTARTNALAEGRTSGINAVKANPTTYGLAPIAEMTATGATPHTNGWYYQPDWGWLWTNAKTFPYVYRASTGGKQPGWLYFREGSAPPYFHNYATGTWSKLGE